MSFDLQYLNGKKIYERESGILMPILSLSSAYGIGDMGPNAYRFIDMLHNANQGLWAMLPNNPTGYGNSPYQAVSAFAGNPYFISPELLVREKLLTQTDVAAYDFGTALDGVDYGKLFDNRIRMLNRAYSKWRGENGPAGAAFNNFCSDHRKWLDDYALYMLAKERYDWRPWYSWPDALKFRMPRALTQLASSSQDRMQFWRFTQYMFFRQWMQLRDYAGQKGVKLVGDIPFYTNHDSADVWANQKLFDLNSDGGVRMASGVPAGNGNYYRWGNPCYKWNVMAADNYEWIAARTEHCAKLYDMLRLDHAVAFVHYFGILNQDGTARWYDGPDAHQRRVTNVIDAVARRHNVDIVAENLGNNNQRTHDLFDSLNWLGMRIADYSISDFHYGTRNIHHPFLYPNNVVAYTGTHDNESLMGMLNSRTDEDLAYMKKSNGVNTRTDLAWSLIDTLYKSSAAKVIIPMQDILGLGNESRMCYADNFEKSWKWRMANMGQFSEKLQDRLNGLSVLTGRNRIPDAAVGSIGWRRVYDNAVAKAYGR